MYYNYKLKQKKNIELAIQNQRIETAHKIIKDKNNEITDSINYALNIQQAILPDVQTISKALPESFVLFKPKDIVSGDFYFFTIDHDRIYIAAADCTGHGVPGGFMSMIGSEKLTNAVRQSSDTGTILSILNKSIKSSLQHSKMINDGIDISLCSIDIKSNTINFSGAYRPVWIIRNNSSIIEELKGNRSSIGGHTPEDTVFATHTVKLAPGDTFYLFTDGYADQFGINDKKMTTKRFKQMLLEIQKNPLSAQYTHLSNFLDTWRGSMEQTDDILIVAIRMV